MYLVFIYYAYVYNVLHFILNKPINQSKNWRNKLRDTAVTDSLTVILYTPAEAEYNPEDVPLERQNCARPNQMCGSIREDSDSEESDTEDCYLEAALSRLAESAEWPEQQEYTRPGVDVYMLFILLFVYDIFSNSNFVFSALFC